MLDIVDILSRCTVLKHQASPYIQQDLWFSRQFWWMKIRAFWNVLCQLYTETNILESFAASIFSVLLFVLEAEHPLICFNYLPVDTMQHPVDFNLHTLRDLITGNWHTLQIQFVHCHLKTFILHHCSVYTHFVPAQQYNPQDLLASNCPSANKPDHH